MVTNQRLTVALVVLMFHGILWYCLRNSTVAVPIEESAQPESTVVMLLKPRLVLESSQSQRLPTAAIKVPANAIVAPDLPLPEISRPIKLTAGIGTLAAGPGGPELPDSKPFASRAGLKTGQGATVVLRHNRVRGQRVQQTALNRADSARLDSQPRCRRQL